MSVRRATEVIERLVVASNASATASPVSSSSWYRVARPCVWNARRALPAVSHDRRDELPPVLGTRTCSNRWTVPEPNVAAVHRKANDLRPRRNNDRGFASSSALRVRDGTGDDTSTPAYVVAAEAFDNTNDTNDDETDGGFGSPPQTRGRTDPHLDETGKTPRSSFHASMQSAIDQKNHRKALEVFDTLSTLYCDDQGAPAYDMLMHLAAMGGDPDAATDAFEAALSLGYPPSSYQHGQIILACARKGDPARGADWLDMVLEAEGLEWAHSSKSSRKLFEKTLAGAAHAGDSVLFDSQWQKMMEMRVKPGEDSIEAFLLLASKTGTSGDVEEAWVSKQFAHLDKKTRSSKLSLRRVEAHARIATDLIRRRDGNCVGTYSKPSDVQKSTVRPGFDVRQAASVSRRAAAVALDDLFTRNSEATTFKTRVKNPKDVRDAVTALAGAYSVVGDSDAITALMERSSSVGVEPDQHVFNALLRSEAADRELGAVEGVGDVGSDEYYDDASEAFDYVNSFVDSSDTETPTETPTTDQRDAAAQHAVIRVETMMRDMIESGVEPDLHSFMALLAAYARAGDVGAAGDALQGMRERNIPLDNVVYNTLLQACATAGDLDAARNVRNQMKHSNVPADAVTFLHLFRACARRSRQVAQVLKDSDDVWDDWDDWLGGGGGSNELGGSGSIPGGSKKGLGSEAARSHARLAGALVDARSSVNKSGVGEAARAAARAAAEGFVSIGDVFKRGVDGLAPGEAAQLLLQRGSPKSPELQRARAALLEFTEDMKNANVNYTKRCATAAMQALGSLREFGAMMRFLRDPPHGVTPDTYMYTQALHLLAQDPFHWRKGGKESGVGGGGDGSTDSTDPTEVSKAESTNQKFTVSKQQQTGPAAALALADEMQGKGITQTRVTLNCVLLACAQLRDFDQALIRFEKHSQAGGEIGADTFNCLFKAAWSGGVFSTKATEIAQAMEEANVAPNSFTELTLRNALNAESQRNGYTSDFNAANELLIRFGFEPELTLEKAWVPMAEREGGLEALDETTQGDSVEDTPHEPNGKEGRRWNRE